MRLLVLGGTAFVGRHIVNEAIAQGHEVTLFNRGQTNPTLFPDVERRTGDRDASDLASLDAGEWDAVIDVNGYVPRVVSEMAAHLSGRVGAYCFISTGSVYAERGPVDTDEDSVLAELEGPVPDERDDRLYGPLKVLCELEAQRAFPGTALIIRPGIVAGAYDASDRFGYWVRRLTRGGPVLCPERPDQPLQLVHAQDQAAFAVDLLARHVFGVFNTVGPDEPMTFVDMVGACANAAGVEPELVWAPDALLRQHNVALPLSVPASGKWDGVFRRSNTRARALGFRNRSIADTAADMLGWDRTRDQESTSQRMLTPEREAEVLALV
ncbi:MAG: NAD-dependent epimerase/dehydratase family protein [Acidimicrobiales bacterium]